MDIVAAPSDVALRDLRMLMKDSHPISPQSTYCQIRRSLVNWVADVCKDLGLTPLTVHCATSCMDRYINTSHLAQQYRLAKYHAFAAASILIAAKLEECAQRVPVISEIVGAHSTRIKPEDVAGAEIQILVALNWRTSACTYLHFLDIHLSQGICSQGDHSTRRVMTQKDQEALVKYMYFFADMCLMEADFSHFSTALTAAAIIAASRQTVRLEPTWTKQLQSGTGYTLAQLKPCLDRIRTEFCRTWPDFVPDHLQRTPRMEIHGERSRSWSDSSERDSGRNSIVCLDSDATFSTTSPQDSDHDVHATTRIRKRIANVMNMEQGNDSWDDNFPAEETCSMWYTPREAPPKVPARKSNLKTGQLLLL